MILIKLFSMAVFILSAGAIFNGYYKDNRILKFLAEFMALVALTLFLEDTFQLFNIESLNSYIVGTILFIGFFIFYFVSKDISLNRDNINFNFNLKIVIFILSIIALFSLFFYSHKVYISNSKEIAFNSIEEVFIEYFELKEKFDSAIFTKVKKGVFESKKDYENKIDLKYSEYELTFFKVGKVKMENFNADKELISLKFSLNIDSNKKEFLKLDKLPTLIENISIKKYLAKELFSDGEFKKVYITVGSKNGSISFTNMVVLDNLENIYLLKNGNSSLNSVENSSNSNFNNITKSSEFISKNIVKIDGVMYQNEPFKEVKWEEAKSYCLNLKLGGYSDWRLPTKKELNKLANIKLYGTWDNYWEEWFRKNNHKKNKNSQGDSFFIRKEFIENIPTSWFWVWSVEEMDSTHAWVVLFNYGHDLWNGKNYVNYALCVRE